MTLSSNMTLPSRDASSPRNALTELVVVLELVGRTDGDEVDDLAGEVEHGVVVLALHGGDGVTVAVAGARHAAAEEDERLPARNSSRPTAVSLQEPALPPQHWRYVTNYMRIVPYTRVRYMWM